MVSVHCAPALISLWSRGSSISQQGTKSTGVLKILFGAESDSS